jgi:hypothetical protein
MSVSPSHNQAIDRIDKALQRAEAEAEDDDNPEAMSALERRRERLALLALRAQIELTQKQIGLASNERFRNRIKALRDGAVSLIVVMAAAAGVFLVWESSRADGVVVEPFQTLPAFEAEGLSGEAVANRLLTEVNAIQAATPSNRSRRTALSSSDQITVEIPATGLSLGEALRILRRRLGDEQVVTGRLDLTSTDEPVVRLYLDGEPLPVRPSAPRDGETAAQAAIRSAAEALFQHSEPYRYAIWLAAEDRPDEARSLLRTLTLTGSAEDRAWAYVGLSSLAQADGALEPMLANASAALALSPGLQNALRGAAQAYQSLGMTGWATQMRRMAQATDTAGPGFRTRQFNDRYYIATAEGDHQAAIGWVDAMVADSRLTDDLEEPIYLRADALARLHDVSAAREAEALASAASLPGERGFKLSALAQRPALEDWPTLESELKDMSRHDPPTSSVAWAEDQWLFRPWLAIALARQGKADEAAAVMGDNDDFGCVLCLQARGDIAAARGDRAGVDRWFGRAAREAPGLPDPLLRWGEARLRLGDAAGALDLARQARRAGPRWADPVRLEAQALAALDRREALARFETAAEMAPRWGALRLDWGRELMRRGRTQAAATQIRAALARDLSVNDEREARRLLGQLLPG